MRRKLLKLTGDIKKFLDSAPTDVLYTSQELSASIGTVARVREAVEMLPQYSMLMEPRHIRWWGHPRAISAATLRAKENNANKS